MTALGCPHWFPVVLLQSAASSLTGNAYLTLNITGYSERVTNIMAQPPCDHPKVALMNPPISQQETGTSKRNTPQGARYGDEH